MRIQQVSKSCETRSCTAIVPENFFSSDLVDHSGRPPPFTAAIMAKRKSSSGADPKSKAAKPSTDVRPADQAYVTCVVSWLLGCVSLC